MRCLGVTRRRVTVGLHRRTPQVGRNRRRTLNEQGESKNKPGGKA